VSGLRGRLLVALVGLIGSLPAHAVAAPSDALVERGRYLATASDCAACHTAPNGKSFAGGLALQSPIGAIYSTNITPSTRAGIGGYTEQQFEQALRRGIRADGANLYSAMPYPSYANLTDDDVSALYAYFMRSVAPQDTVAPRTALPFPLNIRASMMAWNLLFLRTASFEVDASRSTAWNRGRYLVTGLAHCGECHTPRGLLEQPLSSKTLAGGQVDAWFAPNITSDVVSGIGSWNHDEIVRYLRTGRVRGKAQAAGDMGEAVEKSLRYMSDADLDAIAVYLASVPAVRDPTDAQPRFATGKPAAFLAAFRGTRAITSETAPPNAMELFQGNCAACHSAEGQGSRDGYFPSLFHASATGASQGNNLIATLLNGVNRTTAEGQAYMPGFGGKPADLNALDDQQIALLGNFLLDRFGAPQHVAITQEQVAQVRAGGPSSSILLLARIGVAIGAIVLLVVLVIAFRFVRRRVVRTTP
jgi:mono/diheme cytochrome c family protein